MAGISQIKMIFNRRKKAPAANPGTVEIEVSYNRERVRLSTFSVANMTMPTIDIFNGFRNSKLDN